MNVLEGWLEQYFDEVSPREFYRMIFPEGELDTKDSFTKGKYTGIAVGVSKVKKKDGRPKTKRYSVTDDLDVVDEVCATDDFCIMSPISYAGKERTSVNARFLYAFAVDLDRIRVNGTEPVGLENLWVAQIERMDRIPKPTMIVSSGSGLHLYYVLTEPIALFQDTSKELQGLKRDLTSLIWDGEICDIQSTKEVQQEGIYQGFRMPGTITKNGARAKAYLTGGRISVEALQDYTAGIRGIRQHKEGRIRVVKKKEITLKVAKEKYPEWYERRILNKEPKGVWHVSRNLYDWWKGQIYDGAEVGHRYYCLMMLAIYAKKCSMYDEKHNPNPVTKSELERDAYQIMDFLESKTNSEDNHFTTGDVQDALEAFEDKWITFPRSSIEYKSGITIPPRKRNGRKQEVHLRIARQTLEILNDENGAAMQGRPSAEPIVREWRQAHPDGTKADCTRDTGLSKPTVYRHWQKSGG